jgi:uncharacterized protein (TIGR00266 family)
MSSSVPSILRPAVASAGPMKSTHADEIDYEIKGHEMQFVEIELDPGESAIAEAGMMMFKPASVRMDTVFGDASKPDTGILGRIAAAGKRLITGSSLFITVYTHEGQGKARVAFAAPYPGTIMPFKLSSFAGGALIAQKDAFLCGAKGVSISVHFQQKIGVGIFGGQGFVMQRLEGDGWVFIHGGGTVIEKTLADGEELDCDTGSVAAMEPTVGFDIVRAGSIKSMVFGGEGFFFARLKGPGKVWLQSLPFSRLASRMMATAAVHSATGGVSGFSWGFGNDSGGSSSSGSDD